jgi:hypothetical protein
MDYDKKHHRPSIKSGQIHSIDSYFSVFLVHKPKSMSHQSEQTLENKLIDQLTGLGYERVPK